MLLEIWWELDTPCIRESFLNCYSKCDPLLSQVFVTRQKEGGGEKKISSVLAPGRPQELEGWDKGCANS
jgi:hypothetical protein